MRWLLLLCLAGGCTRANDEWCGSTCFNLVIPDLGHADDAPAPASDFSTGRSNDPAPRDLAAPAADLSTAPDPNGDCDLIEQTGCPQNTKCTLSWDGTACVVRSPVEVPTGGACEDTLPDRCVPGDICNLVQYHEVSPPRWVDVCEEFCWYDSDCSQPTVAGGLPPRCRQNILGASQPVCTLSCDPVDGSFGCPKGLACTLFVDEWTAPAFEYTDCEPYGDSGDGADCGGSSESCKPGFKCHSATGVAPFTCRKVCTSSCPIAGQTCHPVPGPLQPHFGVCY